MVSLVGAIFAALTVSTIEVPMAILAEVTVWVSVELPQENITRFSSAACAVGVWALTTNTKASTHATANLNCDEINRQFFTD